MAAIRVAGRALIRPSPGLLRQAAGHGEPRVLQQLLSPRSRGLHSLLNRPSAAAGASMGTAATSRCIIPSNRYMSSSSSSQSSSTRKELAIALMKKEPGAIGDDNQEIKSCDELLHLLKVDAKTDERTKQVVEEERATIAKKKQELALLLLKEEVEGVSDHGYKEKVQEELIAAARRVRDSLLPQAQRHDLEYLKSKYTSLERRHYSLITWLTVSFLCGGVPLMAAVLSQLSH